MEPVHYETADLAMVEAFPELAPAHRALIADWHEYEPGEHPGQYNVLPDLIGRLTEITLALPVGTDGRREVIRRALDLGERLLSAEDPVRSLGVDAIADRFHFVPDAPQLIADLAGPNMREWAARQLQTRQLDRGDEWIDLWNVREALVPLFPSVPAHAIPGISYPSVSPDLETLEAARADPDGAVLLAVYGTNHLLTVVRPAHVGVDDAALNEIARRLTRARRDHEKGSPRAHYRRIPRGERVWNLDTSHGRHDRLWDDPWTRPGLLVPRRRVLEAIRGERPAADLD